MASLTALFAAATLLASSAPDLAHAEPEHVVEALRVTTDGLSVFQFRVVEGSDLRRWLTIDCIERCGKVIHVREAMPDPPLGLLNLDDVDLVYSLWSTGCCYVVRVWHVTPTRVEMILKKGSRGLPSLRTSPEVSIETYMRPSDENGRETGMNLQPIRWRYRAGTFVQLRAEGAAGGR